MNGFCSLFLYFLTCFLCWYSLEIGLLYSICQVDYVTVMNITVTLHSCCMSILGNGETAHLEDLRCWRLHFSLSIPHHCCKEERTPRTVSTQKINLAPSLLAKARHMAIPRSDSIMLFGSRLRVSGNCPDDHSVIIGNDGDLCGLFPEAFKVISVFTSNPRLREIGRLLVSLLLEEVEVEGHREEELVTYLKPRKI